jgi:hypothetical protein
MNLQVTNEIRELTADELDAVAGGASLTDDSSILLVMGIGAWVGGCIGYLLDCIFGD